MSSDFIVDKNMNVWLFEFNMSPVLKDAKDSPLVHDADMIEGGLNLVIPWETGDGGNWDFALTVCGPPPKPKEPLENKDASAKKKGEEDGAAEDEAHTRMITEEGG